MTQLTKEEAVVLLQNLRDKLWLSLTGLEKEGLRLAIEELGGSVEDEGLAGSLAEEGEHFYTPSEVKELVFLTTRLKQRSADAVDVLRLMDLLEKTETGSKALDSLAKEHGHGEGSDLRQVLAKEPVEEIISSLVLIAVGIMTGAGIATALGWGDPKPKE